MTQGLLEGLEPRKSLEAKVQDLGWGVVKRIIATDLDTGETETVSTILDLLPGSGVVLYDLIQSAPLMSVDDLVQHLDHTDRLLMAVKARRKNLAERLQELLRDNEEVCGRDCQVWVDSKRVLKWGVRAKNGGI